MARIIWDIRKDDFRVDNYDVQAFSFNDSKIWMYYGRRISAAQLRKNIRDLSHTYPICKVTVRPLNEHKNIDYVVVFTKGDAKYPSMRLTTPEEASEVEVLYNKLKPVHKRAIFGDPTKFQVSSIAEIPKRQQNQKKREQILAEAAKDPTKYDMKDAEWEIVRNVIPVPRTGRRPRHDREVVNALRWLIGTGALWDDIPERYAPWKTVHNRFRTWKSDGTLERIFAVMEIDHTCLLGKRYY